MYRENIANEMYRNNVTPINLCCAPPSYERSSSFGAAAAVLAVSTTDMFVVGRASAPR